MSTYQERTLWRASEDMRNPTALVNWLHERVLAYVTIRDATTDLDIETRAAELAAAHDVLRCLYTAPLPTSASVAELIPEDEKVST